MAREGRADAYKQLPAVGALQRPGDQLARGFIPKAQLFGAAAAVLKWGDSLPSV